MMQNNSILTSASQCVWHQIVSSAELSFSQELNESCEFVRLAVALTLNLFIPSSRPELHNHTAGFIVYKMINCIHTDLCVLTAREMIACVRAWVCVCVCVCVCVRVFVTNQDIDLYNDTGMTQVLQGEGDFSGHWPMSPLFKTYKSYRVRFFWGKLKCTVSCEG